MYARFDDCRSYGYSEMELDLGLMPEMTMSLDHEICLC